MCYSFFLFCTLDCFYEERLDRYNMSDAKHIKPRVKIAHVQTALEHEDLWHFANNHVKF